MTKKILIADDEVNIVISLEFLMKREGFEVVIASDGEEAIAKILEEKPDLVLLDVMMPRKTGFEVCQEVRSNPELQDLKILMLTAKGSRYRSRQGDGPGRRRVHDQAVFHT